MNLVIEPKRTLVGPERPNTGKNINKEHAQINQRRNRSVPERKNTADCLGKTKSVATRTPKEQPRKTGSAPASYLTQTTEERNGKERQRTPVSGKH